ncbi:MAG TPA: hypothetical protein VFL59_14095 [Candidatus Nanopelagicales bacterium]|nr:hypothetical protein [Candidatus Nanopelagicales bacterium]
MRTPGPEMAPGAARLVVAVAAGPAHELLRREAADFHQVPTRAIVLEHDCGRCGSSEHGRPRILPSPSVRVPASVSLARSGDVSVVAVTDAGDVGVDAELLDAAEFPGFDDVVLGVGEMDDHALDRTRVWVRTEALLKACGTGLSLDPREIAIDDHGRVTSTVAGLPASVRLLDLELLGRAVSVVVVAAERVDDLSVEVRTSDA